MVQFGYHYPLAFLVIGLVFLLFGRSLFWLFVAGLGFVAGVFAAHYFLPHQTELFTLILALVLGILGALLAIFVQKLAVGVAGFAGGGALAVALCAPLLGGTGYTYPGAWLCFLIGGILGAILMLAFFNWALIILTSFHGAHLIGEALPRRPGYLHHPFLIILLAFIGILVQASIYRRRRAATE